MEFISDEYRDPEKTALPVIYTPKTYWNKIALFQSSDLRKPNELKGMVTRPLVFLSFPVVAFCGLTYGFNLGWLAVLNATVAFFFEDEPHYFGGRMVGLAFVSPLIGVAIGSLACGFVGDRLVLRKAHHNDGILESEYRLWLFIPSLVLLPSGLALWGIGSEHNLHWTGSLFAMAAIAFSNTLYVLLLPELPITVNVDIGY
jgi:MFS family permease